MNFTSRTSYDPSNYADVSLPPSTRRRPFPPFPQHFDAPNDRCDGNGAAMDGVVDGADGVQMEGRCVYMQCVRV